MELRPLRAQLAARGGRLVASIGLYRGSSDGNPGIVPLLALSGGLDDWTPAARCVALANMPANRLRANPRGNHRQEGRVSIPRRRVGRHDGARAFDADRARRAGSV
jgi:hypothetical protein